MGRSDERGLEHVEEQTTGPELSILRRLRDALRLGLAGLGHRRNPPRMELVETLALGGKRQLMLVACDGRMFLVGAGGEGVQVIAEMSAQPPVRTSSAYVACTAFSDLPVVSGPARCSA